MPLYVYSCPDCEIEIEELRSVAQMNHPVECPICHGLCVREMSIFNVERVPAAATNIAPTRSLSHRVGCSCCLPRR